MCEGKGGDGYLRKFSLWVASIWKEDEKKVTMIFLQVLAWLREKIVQDHDQNPLESVIFICTLIETNSNLIICSL